MVPGPSVLFVIGRAPAHGRRTALTSVAGNTLGAYVLVAAVALGVGPVVERSVPLFTALTLAGAAYLVHLGFAAGVAHFKTMVFCAAVLPRFVDRAQGRVPLRVLLLGLVFNVIAPASDSTWGLVASAARGWFARSPRRLSAVGGIGGLTLIGPGVTVAATGR